MSVKNEHGLSAFQMIGSMIDESDPLWEKPVTILIIDYAQQKHGHAPQFEERRISGRFGNCLDGQVGYGLVANITVGRKTKSVCYSPRNLGHVYVEVNPHGIVARVVCLDEERDIGVRAIKTLVAARIDETIELMRASQAAAEACLDAQLTQVASPARPKP